MVTIKEESSESSSDEQIVEQKPKMKSMSISLHANKIKADSLSKEIVSIA